MSQPTQNPDWSVSTYGDSEKHIVVVDNGKWMDAFSTVRDKELAQFYLLDKNLDVDIPKAVQEEIAEKLKELNPHTRAVSIDK